MSILKLELDKEREFNLSSEAVEMIEEKYDKPMSEIVEGKLSAKLVNTILFAALIEKDDITEQQFKKELSKKYHYTETIEFMNKLIGEDPKKTDINDIEKQ